VLCASAAYAGLVPVKHREGTAHGFLVLRSEQGSALASGELIQTLNGERVTSRLELHFKDGSVHEETTIFSQQSEFRLISDHLRQSGPSFPTPADVFIDATTGEIKVSITKEGETAHKDYRLPIPDDLANGLVLTLLKNVSPSDAELTLPMIVASPKPKVVKLTVRPTGRDKFITSGRSLTTEHYVVRTELGGVAGAIASVLGKRPADMHYWLVEGVAPAFVKFEGPLFAEGPIWTIELSDAKPAAE